MAGQLRWTLAPYRESRQYDLICEQLIVRPLLVKPELLLSRHELEEEPPDDTQLCPETW